MVGAMASDEQRSTAQQEQLGVAAITQLFAEMGWWVRLLTGPEFGIDAVVELSDERSVWPPSPSSSRPVKRVWGSSYGETPHPLGSSLQLDIG